MSEADYTVSEIKDAVRDLQKRIGKAAHISLSLSFGGFSQDEPYASISPKGIARGGHMYAYGKTWREALEKVSAIWDEQQDAHIAATIRSMALEIISVTMDLGECSDAALRGRGFDQSDIKRFGARACEVANEMAGKGPFEIVAHGASANAPAEAA